MASGGWYTGWNSPNPPRFNPVKGASFGSRAPESRVHLFRWAVRHGADQAAAIWLLSRPYC